MNEKERPEPAADAVDVDRLGSILRMEYARGYQDAKKEGQVRTFSSTSVNDAALQADAAIAAFEEVMLSDEVVWQALFAWERLERISGMHPGETMETVRRHRFDQMEAALQAALAAAKGTEGSE